MNTITSDITSAIMQSLEADILRLIKENGLFLDSGLATSLGRISLTDKFMHIGCLALEKKQLIRRRLSEPDFILWEAV